LVNLPGLSYLLCDNELVLSTSDIFEGKDPSHPPDESGWAVSLLFLLCETTANRDRTCIASVMRFSAIRGVFRSSDVSCKLTPYFLSLNSSILPQFLIYPSNLLVGDGYELSFWSSCEYHIAIITACIPTIKPLYVKCVNKTLSLMRKQSPTTSQETDETYVAHRSKFMQPELKFSVEV
jgi:hypothetical protein